MCCSTARAHPVRGDRKRSYDTLLNMWIWRMWVGCRLHGMKEVYKIDLWTFFTRNVFVSHSFHSIFFPFFFSASLLFFRRWLRLPLMRWKTPSSLIAAAAILVTQLMNHLRERNCLKRTTRCQRRRMSAKMRMKWQPQLFIAHYNLEWDGWWCLWLYTNPPENRLLAFNYAKLSLQPCIESEMYLLVRDDSVFV